MNFTEHIIKNGRILIFIVAGGYGCGYLMTEMFDDIGSISGILGVIVVLLAIIGHQLTRILKKLDKNDKS